MGGQGPRVCGLGRRRLDRLQCVRLGSSRARSGVMAATGRVKGADWPAFTTGGQEGERGSRGKGEGLGASQDRPLRWRTTSIKSRRNYYKLLPALGAGISVRIHSYRQLTFQHDSENAGSRIYHWCYPKLLLVTYVGKKEY